MHHIKDSILESISKIPVQYSDGCKLHKAEKILGVVFPSTKESTLQLNPDKEAFHQPAPLIATQSAAVLRIEFNPSLLMWRDYFNALLVQFFIQFVVVVSEITNQIFRLRLDYVEVKTRLYQGDLMMVGGVRADRQWQAMTIHNCHDFHTLTTLLRANLITADFCRGVDLRLNLTQDLHLKLTRLCWRVMA